MPFRLYNKIQNYAWGGVVFIPNLLGIENKANEPFAELWMGTHHRGESEVQVGEQRLLLSEFIAKNPIETIGKATADKFENKLPYLFKVLAVKKMLSIQSHPAKKAAEIGFAYENEIGIPLTAKNRNYKDDNHKPEVMVALTEFWLLHGFKSIEGIEEVLNTVPEFEFLKASFKEKDIFHLYKTVMEIPQEQVNEILKPLQVRLSAKENISKSSADYWAKLGFEQHTHNGNLDKGIFSVYLYNLLKLEEGQGIYQAVNVPHVYLEGVNIELMANSDNVLRGGLTFKHVDLPELLKHLSFESVTPVILEGIQVSNNERVYKTIAPDFEVSCISIKEGEIYKNQNNDAPEIYIVTDGELTVNKEIYQKGESFFVSAGEIYDFNTKKRATLYKATVPFD
jgi:mannose-6-phosphate isomerase